MTFPEPLTFSGSAGADAPAAISKHWRYAKRRERADLQVPATDAIELPERQQVSDDLLITERRIESEDFRCEQVVRITSLESEAFIKFAG